MPLIFAYTDFHNLLCWFHKWPYLHVLMRIDNQNAYPQKLNIVHSSVCTHSIVGVVHICNREVAGLGGVTFPKREKYIKKKEESSNSQPNWKNKKNLFAFISNFGNLSSLNIYIYNKK